MSWICVLYVNIQVNLPHHVLSPPTITNSPPSFVSPSFYSYMYHYFPIDCNLCNIVYDFSRKPSLRLMSSYMLHSIDSPHLANFP